MDDTTALDRMRAVEARFLSLPADADAAAVRAGVERLRAQLAEARSRERDEVVTVSIADPGGRSVYFAVGATRVDVTKTGRPWMRRRLSERRC